MSGGDTAVPTATRRRRTHGSVRMELVAERAGVSTITVSRVLNQPDKVAKDTRTRVWAAIEATGYIPNLIAGGLASSRTRVVGIIVPTIVNSIFADTVQGMTDVLGAESYQLLLATSGYSLKVEAELVSAFLAQRPSGLVLTGLTHAPRTVKLLERAEIPLVETWSSVRKPIDMLVGFSNEKAAFEMMRSLAAAGYRKIGFVSAPIKQNDRALGRRKGYRRAVKQLGLVDDRTLEREALFSLQNGSRALSDLVGQHPDVEAIFFANDILAAGGLLECARRGWPVPERLGIAGFDDVDLASQMVPTLTTVRIPRYEIGATAARLILARLAGKTVEQRVLDLGFEVVVRGSTRSKA
jgi:LacI family gluconate utilization system Gnt-I transcriptional repressor